MVLGFLFVFPLLTLAPAAAQDPLADQQPTTAALAGTVREQGLRTPLAGVLVTVLVLGDEGAEVVAETWTDEDGRFALDDLPPGRFLVHIDEPGWALFESPVLELGAGARLDDLSLYLTPDDPSAGAYETRARRRAAGNETAAARHVVERDAIERVGGGRNDPLSALQSLPGVARTAFGTAHLAFRGAAPQDSRATLDGVPLPRAFHAGGLRALLPAAIIDRVVMFTSNPPPSQGNVLGGLVELDLRAPQRDDHHGIVAIDFIEALAVAEGPLAEHAQYLVSARRSFIEIFAPLIAEASSVALESAPSYWDYLLRLTTQPASGHELEALAFGAGDLVDLVATDENGAKERLRGATTLHRVQFRHRYTSARLEHDLLYAVSPQQMVSVDDTTRYDQRIVEHMARQTLTVRPDPRLTLRLGSELIRTDGRLVSEDQFQRHQLDIVAQQERWAAGGFLAASLELARGVVFEIGGRLDSSGLVDGLTGDLRGRLSAEEGGLRVAVNLGTTSQPPHALDVELIATEPRWERALHASFELAWQLPWYEPLSLEASVFHIERTGLPSLTTYATQRIDEVDLGQHGEQRSVGLELMLRHALANRFVGWISYTFSHTEGRRLPELAWEAAPYNQPHNLQVVGAVMLPDRWQIALRFALVTGSPYTMDTRELFGTVVGKRFDPAVEVDPFHRLDLRVDKTWLFDLWQLAVWLDVEGVYFHRNVELAGLSLSGAEFRVQGLPILPSFGVSAQY